MEGMQGDEARMDKEDETGSKRQEAQDGKMYRKEGSKEHLIHY